MRSVASSLTVAAVYLVSSLLFTDYRHVFEFNPDEGNNLVKAILLQQGLSFSSGIWSDQPPLFAYALVWCFELFGTEIAVARGLVLVTSALLVFALHDSVRKLAAPRFGTAAAQLAAAVAVACVLLCARFAPLRVSVLIGIPSIAMLTLALWAALQENARARYQFAAGVFLGLSLAIKLFTLFVAPIVYLTLLAPELAQLRAAGVRPLVRPSLRFVAGLALVLLAVFAPLSADAFLELFRSHLDAERDRLAGGSIRAMLAMDAPIYLAALASVPLLARARLLSALPWLAWLTLGIAVLSVHHPLWLHHSQLIVVPAAALAGLGTATLIGSAAAGLRAKLALALGTVLAVALPLAAGDRVRRLQRPGPRHESPRDRAALEVMRRAEVPPGRIVTARQIYAFYLQRPVPAELAVTSIKRLSTQGLAGASLLELIDSPDTQLVLVSDRWPSELRDQVREAVRDGFDRLYAEADLEVWRRTPRR